MAEQGVELTGDLPAGWISVEPAVVNEDAASIVLLRRADLDQPFTTNITVSEEAIAAGADLAAVATEYRGVLAGQVEALSVLREGYLSDSPPRQYAQDLGFTVVLNGRDIDVKQSQFLLETPTEEPAVMLVLKVLYSAPADIYDAGKSAVVEVLETLSAQRVSADRSASSEGGGQDGLAKEHLEREVKRLLEQSAGQQAEALVCNGGLPARVGAIQRCALSVGDGKLGVTVTVVGVADGDVKFDIQVDAQPMV